MAKKNGAATALPFTGTVPNTETLPKLRDIGNMEQHVELLLQAAEGEVTPEIEQIMNDLDADRVGFFERWAMHIRNREAQVEFLTGAAAPFLTEAERIADRAKTIANDVKRSRDRLLFELEKRGMTVVKGKELTISVVNNPAKVVNAETVPTEVLERLFNDEDTRHLIAYTPESFALDKSAVKKEIETSALPEALIEANVGLERGKRLSID